MPVLNTADALRLGASPVDRVYLGANRVWPAVVAPSYDEIVLADGPSGYWALNETSGITAVDLSGNGRNGTYMNTGDFTLAGQTVGSFVAPNFGGTNAYVNLGDNDAWSAAGANGKLTLEAWIIAEVDTAKMIVAKGNGGNYEYRFNTDANTAGTTKLDFVVTSGAQEQVFSVTPPLVVGQAYHVAVTYDRAAPAVKFYVNGVQIGATQTPNINGMINYGAALEIGRRSDGALGTWDGAIAQVGVYQHVLSADRIAEHYIVGAGLSDYEAAVVRSKPSLFLPLDDASSARALVGVDATIVGTPTQVTATPGSGLAGAIATDGVDDRIEFASGFPGDGSMTTQTFEFWLDYAQISSASPVDQYVFSFDSTARGVGLGDSTGTLSGEVLTVFDNAARTAWGNLTIPAGWHHYAFVYAGGANNWTLYIDGVEAVAGWGATKLSSSGGASGMAVATGQIGQWFDSGSHYALPGFTAFALYPRALDAAEIVEHHAIGLGGEALPVSPVGLQQWYRSDDLGDDATGVAQWNDASGNGRHLVQATAARQPLVVAGELNGHKVARLDGTDDHLFATHSGFKLQSQMTIFVTRVYSKEGVAGIWCQGGGSDHDYNSTGGGALTTGGGAGTGVNFDYLKGYNTTTANPIHPRPGVDNSDWAICAVYLNGSGTSGISVNGGSFLTDPYNAFTAADTIRSCIGTRVSSGAPDLQAGLHTQMDIAELLEYNVYDADVMRQSIDYLAEKYGIAVAPADQAGTRVMWLDADDLGADATAVSLWPDKSGAGRYVAQPTAAKQPVVVANAINGHKAVRFDGTDDHLFAFHAGYDALIGDMAFWVMRVPGAALAQVEGFVCRSNSGADDFRTGIAIDSGAGAQFGITRGYQIGDITEMKIDRPAGDAWAIYEVTQTAAGAARVAYNGNAAQGTDNGTMFASTLNLTSIASRIQGGYNNFAQIDVAEVICVNGYDATERTNILNYLSTKYGIALV